MNAPSFVPNWRACEPMDFDHYAWWVNALTEQGLHAKSDIALTLAMLTERIEFLEAVIQSNRPSVQQKPEPK